MLPYAEVTDQDLKVRENADRFLADCEAEGWEINHDWEAEQDSEFVTELAICVRDVVQLEFARSRNQIH